MNYTLRYLDRNGDDVDPGVCDYTLTTTMASGYVQLHDVETGDDHCVFCDMIEVEATLGYAGTSLRCIPFAVLDAARAMLNEALANGA